MTAPVRPELADPFAAYLQSKSGTETPKQKKERAERERLARLIRAVQAPQASEATRVQPDPTRRDPFLMFAELAANVAPVTGEALAARDFVQAVEDRDLVGGALAGIGMLPAVGMIGRTARAAGKAADVAKAAEAVPLPRLSALHNTRAANLEKSLELGGFPVPSIAVVPEHVPFEDFGDITLIGKRSLGDPATSRVFSADAYTARVPEVVYPKLGKKQAQDFWKQTTGTFGSRYGDDAFRALEDGNLDLAVERASRSDDLARAYLRRQGVAEPSRELLEQAPRSPGFSAFVREVFAPIMQNPQVKVGRELREWSVDNVAEAMARSGKGVEKNVTYGPGAVRAAGSKQFTDLEAMRRAAAARVQIAPEAVKAAEQELKDAAFALTPSYRYSSTWSALDDAHKAAAKRGPLAQNLRALDFVDPPPEAVERLAQAARNVQNAPVKYFEAKPPRGVRFDEFAGAVVPAETPQTLIEALKQRGLAVERFQTPAQRQETVARLRRLLNDEGKGTLFSIAALLGLGAANQQPPQQ
jgi:hypothetical protein